MTEISAIEVTVRYAETDQMGVVYHANHLIWCDMARVAYLRDRGISYRDLEADGLRLAVVDASLRYRGAARFDDRISIRCWVRATGSRLVEFGYVMDTADAARPIATARTTLVALNASYAPTVIPDDVRRALRPIRDPVRL